MAVTVLAVPTAAEAKVAVPPVQLTTSAPITPLSVQPGVNVAAVMVAVVVAVVADKV